jgi:hypothetical protein
MTLKIKLTILVLFSAVAVAACEDDSPACWPHREFDAKAWAATPSQERCVFVEDLMSGRLLGLSQGEVLALLGPADSPSSNEVLHWETEEGSGFTMFMGIGLHFDRNGRVDRVFVSRD